MRHVTLALLLVSCAVNAAPGITQDEAGFDVHKISERVILVSDRAEGTPQLAIASEKGIVVFDSHWSNITAAKFRAAIAEAFGRDDFAYTVNHVERVDFIGGNETYKDTTIIAHEYLREVLDKERVEAEVKELIEMWRWKERVSSERLATHEPGSDREKGERAWMLTCKRRADELEQGFSLFLPSVYYNDRLTLDLGDITLKLIYFGKAGYDGMTVFHVPEERLAIISGFIMHEQHLAPYPQPDYTKLDVFRWIAVLEEILSEEAGVEKVLCGMYERVWSREQALQRLGYVKKLWGEVTALEAEGLTLAEVQESLSLDGAFSFVKEWGDYQKHGDDWFRPQHVTHVRLFYLQHKKMASELVINKYESSDITSALAEYKRLLENPGDLYFDEPSFNGMGYYLLSGGQVAEAIELFKMNVAAFPESANVYDSLGEAYMKHGDTEPAIANYRKSLELNPDNENAKSKLSELGVEK
ncbi:MAG TPA: tetratricopeptide repeat protein [Acidobacteriota bacterium]|nr:tetratricopeptide repeat protein [Acidobacteriota bacterium]